MKGFEPNYLRKTYRVTLPARVLIENKEYKTIDWSFEGFGIEKTPEDRFDREKEYTITFIVPFAGFNISFKARAKPVWQSDNRAGFEFIQLPEEAKLVLKEYIEAYVEGRLKDVEGIVSATDIRTVPPYLDKPLTEEEKRELDRKFKVRALIYGALFLVLLIGFYLVVIYSPVVHSVEAFYGGRMINVISPAKAVIKEIKVSESDRVFVKKILAVLERIEFERRDSVANVIKVQKDIANLEAERSKIEAQIEKNLLRIKSLRKELKALNEELKVYEEAYAKGYIGKKTLEEINSRIRRLRDELEMLKKDTLQKEELLRLLNRKLASVRVSTKVSDYSRKRFYETVEISPDGSEIRLLSPISGRVLSVYKREGEIVRSGEPILALEDTGKRGYVIGRFKKKDAIFINVGDEAVVYFPSLGVSVKGTVTAIGKFSMYDESVVSESEEYALEDVPVKVVLEEIPEGAHQGLKAEVAVKTRNYKPFIIQFLERLLNEG